MRILVEIIHLAPPCLVDASKLLALQWHLFLNISTTENRLQIHPSRLALDHDFQSFPDQYNLSLNRVSFVHYSFDVRRGLEHCEQIKLVVEEDEHIVKTIDDMGVCFLEWNQLQF